MNMANTIADFKAAYGAHVPRVEEVIRNPRPLLDVVRGYIVPLAEYERSLHEGVRIFLETSEPLRYGERPAHHPGSSVENWVRFLEVADNPDFNQLYADSGVVLAQTGYKSLTGRLSVESADLSSINLQLLLSLVHPRVIFQWYQIIDGPNSMKKGGYSNLYMQRSLFDAGFPIQTAQIRSIPKYGNIIAGTDLPVSYIEPDNDMDLAMPAPPVRISDLDDNDVIVKDRHNRVRLWVPPEYHRTRKVIDVPEIVPVHA